MKKPTAVSHLLEKGEGMLQRLRQGAAQADRTLAVLRGRLPPDLAPEVWSATLKGTTLTALVRSAAWGTRLRYVAPRLLEELGKELGAEVTEVKVKVRAEPRGRSP